jgi:MFS family permease
MDPSTATIAEGTRSRSRATLGVSGAAHFVHDGFTDGLYVLLPLWSQEFGLSLTQVGVLKTVFSGALASFQLPVAFLAECFGERALLAGGTVAIGLVFVVLGFAGGFVALAAGLLAAGLAAGCQHPLASSLVSRASAAGRRRAALGAYNFAGDLGKVVMPFVLAALAAALGWRAGVMACGLFGAFAGLGVYLALRRLNAGGAPAAPAPHAGPAGTGRRGWGIRERRGFALLSAIGVLDGAARAAFLTFVPFLLIAKGAAIETVGFALALIFAGGAAGKLACGLLAERFGIIRSVVLTELMTGAGILALLAVPLSACLALLPLVGLALNGTSSVLYGTVGDLVDPERQSRAFGLFYTLGIGAAALAPSAFGVASDLYGVPVTLVAVAALAFATVPLCPPLGRVLRLAAARPA